MDKGQNKLLLKKLLDRQQRENTRVGKVALAAPAICGGEERKVENMSRLIQKDEQGNWCLRGCREADFRIGKTITKDMYEAFCGAIWQLKEYESTGLEPDEVRQVNDFETSISAIQELQQYKERLEQLKRAEVLVFQCKLPNGRICHFSDFFDFIENGQVK